LSPQASRAAAWGPPTQAESRWPASIAVMIALGLYITLPGRLHIGPVWLIPALELALLLPLSLTAPRREYGEARWRRVAAIALIAVLNLANVLSLIVLVQLLLVHPGKATGTRLLAGAAQLWLTNIIVFALWYWELDRGGPNERCSQEHKEPDFLFPQMVTPGAARQGWGPKFLDYLYVSFTNASAFSPTDTMPLTAWAKMLMLVQALASLLTVALVAARAVNILN
jgi:uncharacterized membrane protein